MHIIHVLILLLTRPHTIPFGDSFAWIDAVPGLSGILIYLLRYSQPADIFIYLFSLSVYIDCLVGKDLFRFDTIHQARIRVVF